MPHRAAWLGSLMEARVHCLYDAHALVCFVVDDKTYPKWCTPTWTSVVAITRAGSDTLHDRVLVPSSTAFVAPRPERGVHSFA
eukprot:scaffold938_cov334-Pavlova_lutheri.AAC.36